MIDRPTFRGHGIGGHHDTEIAGSAEAVPHIDADFTATHYPDWSPVDGPRGEMKTRFEIDTATEPVDLLSGTAELVESTEGGIDE